MRLTIIKQCCSRCVSAFDDDQNNIILMGYQYGRHCIQIYHSSICLISVGRRDEKERKTKNTSKLSAVKTYLNHYENLHMQYEEFFVQILIVGTR